MLHRRPWKSPLVAFFVACGHLFGQSAGLVQADQTISTAVSGPVNGDNGQTTITASGSVTNGAGAAVISTAGNTITTLSNAGGLDGSTYGLDNNNTTIGVVTNSGTIIGGSDAIFTTGTIGSLTNILSGTVSGSVAGVNINGGGVTSLTNAGFIGGDFGVQGGLGTTLGSLVNSGTIFGNQSGVNLFGATGSITNLAAGTIEGATYAIANRFGSLDSVSNAGTIGVVSNLPGAGIYNLATITSITNSGTMSVAGGGIWNSEGAIGTVTNTGSVAGSIAAVINLASIDTLTNAAGGTMSGDSYSIVNTGTIGTLSNQFGGTITGGGSAVGGIVNLAGSIATLENAGSLTVGVSLQGGSIGRIANTGALGAIRNDSGVIGTGAGLAIESTGAGSSIGEIVNGGTGGTISGGITVANQDLVIRGATSPSWGTIQNGAIIVQNGSLTFVDGGTLLDSDVIVSSIAGIAGAGAMVNQGELLFTAARQLDGSFSQSGTGRITTILDGVSQFGSLAITGNAAIGGELNLFEGSLSLAAGESFSLFSFASATGDFTGLLVNDTALTSLGGGRWAFGSLILSEIWSPTSMRIDVSAVPEVDPAGIGSVLTLIAGALGLLERRRLKLG